MAAASNTARSLALVALAAACERGATPTPPETISKGAPPLASKAFYRVDAEPIAPCKTGATCEAKLVLTALGTYKVNDDYPTKFVADATSTVPIEGEGTFKIAAAKQATMTVRFTPTKPGAAKLVGTFKLSVCNDDTCEIESPKIALDVPSS
jgi:hypothetical protein